MALWSLEGGGGGWAGWVVGTKEALWCGALGVICK